VLLQTNSSRRSTLQLICQVKRLLTTSYVHVSRVLPSILAKDRSRVARFDILFFNVSFLLKLHLELFGSDIRQLAVTGTLVHDVRTGMACAVISAPSSLLCLRWRRTCNPAIYYRSIRKRWLHLWYHLVSPLSLSGQAHVSTDVIRYR
jgi:hypothetical protein